MEWIIKLLQAAAGVVSVDINPGGFATLIAVLLFSAAVLLFREAGEKIRLWAFALLVLACGGLTVSVFVPPPKVPPKRELNVPEPSVPPQLGVAGWVYYQVGKDGQLTGDGQLAPFPPTGPLPNFRDIKRGQRFRAASAIRLRPRAPDTDEDLAKPPTAILSTGTCVVAQRDAELTQEVDVKQARSGGWLYVQVQPCGT